MGFELESWNNNQTKIPLIIFLQNGTDNGSFIQCCPIGINFGPNDLSSIHCAAIAIDKNDPFFRNRDCISFVRSQSAPELDCVPGPSMAVSELISDLEPRTPLSQQICDLLSETQLCCKLTNLWSETQYGCKSTDMWSETQYSCNWTYLWSKIQYGCKWADLWSETKM